MGRISSRIGWKIVPSLGRAAGPRVSAWADVAHSPTRSLSHRVLAAERGIADIAPL
ncbi:hypothetical protein OG555_15640 [Kribbella sp. NBC_01484]|uniref:hypothetical protein n=1 Tax=Kribbella sp. NBC_01484 TaxID=2903579 RepID=UPI002E2F0A18|nr:hypothetical protein [Kribbella sp. NBC_01484]